MMWRSLAAINLPDASNWGFEELLRRAENQIERTEVERLRAVQRAFDGTG
jgi:hypothetical protein